MPLATLNLTNSKLIRFLKGIIPPFLYNFLYKNIIVGDIPSKEFYNLHYQPWDEHKFKRKFNNLTASNPAKFYVLKFCLNITSQLNGDIAEAGVWKGGSAKFILNEADKITTKRKFFYLFDSFEGMKITDKRLDKHKVSNFSDTSLIAVKKFLTLSESKKIKCVFRPGWIPDSFAGLRGQYSFVHIDLDLYEPIKHSLEFFYKRLVKHGIILMDDYGFASCPGAKKAADDFCKKYGVEIFVLHSGQSIIMKN